MNARFAAPPCRLALENEYTSIPFNSGTYSKWRRPFLTRFSASASPEVALGSPDAVGKGGDYLPSNALLPTLPPTITVQLGAIRLHFSGRCASHRTCGDERGARGLL